MVSVQNFPPTVFHFQWPEDIWQDIMPPTNPVGSLTNSDLEMAALVLLFLVIEAVRGSLMEKSILLCCDNSPSIHWDQCLAVKNFAAAT